MRHPLGNKKRLISLSAQGQMASAAMHLIGDDKGGLSKKRMKRIGDDNLAAQNPGIADRDLHVWMAFAVQVFCWRVLRPRACVCVRPTVCGRSR